MPSLEYPGAQGEEVARPPVVGAGSAVVASALTADRVVALPAVGGYCLAVRAGSGKVEEQLALLAADPEGPHYAVGSVEAVRGFTSGWGDELAALLSRCWPGPLEVFVRRAAVDGEDEGMEGAWAVTVGMPDGRALRKLCRDRGPWRTVPLRITEADQVAAAFEAADVACVVDGGSREGEPPTVVDATVTPVRVLREGALPTSFIEGTMLMNARRRLFSRSRPKKGD